jgi:hypothetical protein
MADRMNSGKLAPGAVPRVEEVRSMAARMRKRPDGRYCVSVSYEDVAGNALRHHVYGKTQTEANAKAKAVRERLDSGATA